MDSTSKRKTPFQLRALEDFFCEEKYPSRSAMEDIAETLGLTYKQVRNWFIERRRREKNRSGTVGLPSKYAEACKRQKNTNLHRELLSPDYILKKVFRKDGPPLGVEFDSLPSEAFDHNRSGAEKSNKRIKVSKDAMLSYQVCSMNRAPVKKHGMGKGLMNSISLEQHCMTEGLMKSAPVKHGMGKGLMKSSLVKKHGAGKSLMNNALVKKHGAGKGLMNNALVKKHGAGKGLMNNALVKKHGVGKGLMAVWRLSNPDAGGLPDGFDFAGNELHELSEDSNIVPHIVKQKNKRKQVHRKIVNPSQSKRKPLKKAREVKLNKDQSQRQLQKEKCEHVVEGEISQERLDQIAMLADDEEVELREVQAGPNPLACSDHFATGGLRTCSLCKDLLAKFPPDSIKMKQPFRTYPWISSPDMVKKLLKVFQFLYTHAKTVELCPFTLDEFAQAFLDKESLLLGKTHVVLLSHLLSDVGSEICSGFLPQLRKSCKFLALLQAVGSQPSILHLWKKSLNPLTWPEILRQVLASAGFGLKQGAIQNDDLSKERNSMLKYGLSPGTLKGEIFRILSEQGSCGMKVSALAKSLSVADLGLADTTEQLEEIICATLSSDIRLFEKISSCAYRLRISFITREADDFESDTEDSGSVDDNPIDSGNDNTADESECNSGVSIQRKQKRMNHCKSKNNMLTVYSEIDESHPGEVWLLGLTEGEYSDLSIEEKLNALVAITDLLNSGSSVRTEDPTYAIAKSVPSIYQCGSGAKIKRPSAMQRDLEQSTDHVARLHDVHDSCMSLECQPVESLMPIVHLNGEKNTHSEEEKTDLGIFEHTMQTVFLGSDRRYNRYWLFLGPCNSHDPGHKRVYFESSEDGHWEMIDNKEAFQALLSVLDVRGKREAFLGESLEKWKAFLINAMSSKMMNTEINQFAQSDQSELDMVREENSPISDVDNNFSLNEIVNESSSSSGAAVIGFEKGEEQKQKWIRLQQLDAWIWNCFYSNLNAVKYRKRSYFDSLMRCHSCHDLYWRDERHCRICHTTFEVDFDLEERYAIHAATCKEQEEADKFPSHKVFPSQLQSLKAAVYAIESVMPKGSLRGAWRKSAHKLWIKRLRRTSSLAELLQVLSDFIGAISEDWLRQQDVAQDPYTDAEHVIASFATIPQTLSAIALWLVKLDAIVAHSLEGALSRIR